MRKLIYKLRISVIILFLIHFGKLNSLGQKTQVFNPYNTLKYDSVVIYDFDFQAKGKEFIPIIDEKGRLAPTVKKAIKLDAKTAQELSNRIGAKSSDGQGTAFCFEPHLGIVYYKKSIPISDINLCIECNKLNSNLRIAAQEQGRQQSGKDIYYISDGMSKEFRKYLNQLLQKYKFSHQIKPGSMFD